MKQRIILTESQVRFLQNKMKKKQVVKITESQFNSLEKSQKTELLKENVGEVPTMEFFEQIMLFIESMCSGEKPQVPELAQQLGLDAGKLKELLIGHGVLKMVRTDDGLIPKIKADGISKSLGKILNDIQKDVQPEAKETEEVVEEPLEEDNELQEDYPDGAQHDPNAPYNQPEEESAKHGDTLVKKILGLEDNFVLCEVPKGVVLTYIDDREFYQNDRYDNQEAYLSNFLDVADISEGIEDFIAGDYDAVFVTPENLNELCNALAEESFESVAAMLQDKLGGSLNEIEETEEETIEEMTTTGDVGGSYETPGAWSKDPKKPRHSDKTMIKGGKFINPAIGDNMDSIR